MVFGDLEPLIGYHFLRCWPCVFGLILSSKDVVMNGLFRVVYTQGKIIFYYPHGICFRGLLIENNCFKME